MEHVEGVKKGKVVLYALSTCVWCQKTKKFLNELGIDYYYIFVDQLSGKEKEEIVKEVSKWNRECSFPTIVIDDKSCLVGYQKEELQKRFE